MTCTTTGQQLADHLDQYRCILHGGALPAYIGRPIQAALKKADQKLRRMVAIQAILGIIDPTGDMSAWHRAEWIADGISRLSDTRRRGFESGRLTATPMESLLLVLLENKGPTCHGRLWKELKKLT